MNCNVKIIEHDNIKAELIEALKEAFPSDENNPNWKLEGIRGFVGNGLLLLGYMDDKIAGFLYGYFLPKLDGKQEFYIHELGTSPGFRRMGVMKNIFDCLFAELKNRSISTAWTLTEPDNLAACGLYSKSGGDKKEQVLFDFEL